MSTNSFLIGGKFWGTLIICLKHISSKKIVKKSFANAKLELFRIIFIIKKIQFLIKIVITIHFALIIFLQGYDSSLLDRHDIDSIR